jgi:acetylornithine/N-succinyldiaminopimelate aminotransferase
MLDRLQRELGTTEGVIEVRGRGLMIGIELNRPCGELVKQGLERGILINVTRDKVVRLLPPLVISAQEAEQLLDILIPMIKGFLSAHSDTH